MEKDNPLAETVVKEIVKPVYEDLFQPSTRELGKALGTVFGCLNEILAPLERRRLSTAAKNKAFLKDLEKEFELISPDKRQEPDLKIVWQIGEKLRYTESDELREMFRRLILSSMTKGKAVHPLFVDAVDKMTPEDARLFNLFNKRLPYKYPNILHHRCQQDLIQIKIENESINLNCEPLLSGTVKNPFLKDTFWELDEAKILPSHLILCECFDNLNKLNLVNKQLDESYYVELMYQHDASVKDIIPVFNGSIPDSELSFLYALFKRLDIEKWVKVCCERIYGESFERTYISVYVSVVSYRDSNFGQRLSEILQPPSNAD